MYAGLSAFNRHESWGGGAKPLPIEMAPLGFKDLPAPANPAIPRSCSDMQAVLQFPDPAYHHAALLSCNAGLRMNNAALRSWMPSLWPWNNAALGQAAPAHENPRSASDV